MSSYDTIYDAERVSQIGQIMPRFNEHVQAGDIVQMGIMGDALCPYTADTRPTATVTDVVRHADGVDVHMSDNASGQSFVVPKNTMDPALLWEFNNQTFDNVLQRAMNTSGDESAGAEPYNFVDAAEPMSSPSSPLGGGGDGAAAMSFDEPSATQQYAAPTEAALMNELAESRGFANNMVRVVKQMARDNMRMEKAMMSGFEQLGLNVQPVCKFSPMYCNEYKSIMSDASSHSSSSDFGGDDNHSVMSDSSSAGSEFAASLLADQ